MTKEREVRREGKAIHPVSRRDKTGISLPGESLGVC